MAGSPSHPPYLQAADGAANDSGLDLPLEDESPVLGSSTVGEVGPLGLAVEGSEAAPPGHAEDEAS
jgi:hypothetical protein